MLYQVESSAYPHPIIRSDSFASPSQDKAASFGFRLNRKRLREVRRREGRYLLRTNLCKRDPVELWSFYIQLVEIEAVFKTLKDDLSLRPFFHRREDRIEAHIFVAFLACCLQVTLRARLRALAPGLTPRAVLDKFAATQMLDVHFPTTDGRTLILGLCLLRLTEKLINVALAISDMHALARLLQKCGGLPHVFQPADAFLLLYWHPRNIDLLLQGIGSLELFAAPELYRRQSQGQSLSGNRQARMHENPAHCMITRTSVVVFPCRRTVKKSDTLCVLFLVRKLRRIVQNQYRTVL